MMRLIDVFSPIKKDMVSTYSCCYFLIAVILLCCVLPQHGTAQYFDEFRFKDIEINKSDNNQQSCDFFSIIEDKQGYIWAATSKGVKRYDGRNVFTLKHEFTPDNRLENALIREVFQDSKGWIWIGTQGDGLCRYNYLDASVECFQHDPQDPTSISNNQIWCVYEDHAGRLWIGTEEGLNQFNYEDKTFISYDDTSTNSVLCIQEDTQHRLWFGGWDSGLKLLIPPEKNPASNQTEFLTIKANSEIDFRIHSDKIWDILIDKSGRMWLATFGGGVILMIPPSCEDYYQCKAEDFQFAAIRNEDGGVKKFPNNFIFTIAEDNTGLIWVGTASGGVIFDGKAISGTHPMEVQQQLDTVSIQSYNPMQDARNKSLNRQIRDIYIDKYNFKWFANLGKLSQHLPNISRFKTQPITKNKSASIVTAFFRDDAKKLYLGLEEEGVYIIDTSLQQPQQLLVKHPEMSVRALLKTPDGTLWIGAVRGLFSYDEKQGLKSYKLNFPEESSSYKSYIAKIFLDSKGQLWLGSDKGLILFDYKNGKYRFFQTKENTEGTLNHNAVIDITEDAQQNLYIATQGGGINILSLRDTSYTFQYLQDLVEDNQFLKSNILISAEVIENSLWIGAEKGVVRYDIPTRKIHTYKELDERVANQVHGILSDSKGKIWISTSLELFAFDYRQNRLESYTFRDGISRSLSYLSAYKDDQGKLYFGGANDYTTFYPEAIPQRQFSPNERVLITGLEIAGESVNINEKDKLLGYPILQKNISETDAITLSTKHRNIIINFTMLDQLHADRYIYLYRMKGIDEDWYATNTKINESYSTLAAGDYVFEVKAKNSDGFVSMPTRLKIKVKAPIWQTTAFRLCAALVGLLFIFSIFRYRKYINDLNTKKLEALVDERTEELHQKNLEKEAALQEAKRASRAKTTFLTTMSHEIRTPLNGLLGMAQLLKDTKLDHEQKELVDVMKNSGNSLLHLVNDILDLTKIESGKIDLELQAFELQKAVQEVIEQLNVHAQMKQLELNYHLPEHTPAWIISDKNRLQQILLNLINNSIKFTKIGQIDVLVNITENNQTHKLDIEVKDTGIGISKAQQHLLFNAFVQADNSTTRQYGGTGLGLTICARIVELLNGKIHLKSKENIGTSVFFSIPIQVSEAPDLPAVAPPPIINNKTVFADSYPLKILVAEDNKFNRILIGKVLERLGYEATFVEDGLAAVAATQKETFDYIFMDLNMPKMGGMEASKIITAQQANAPVIVALTANVQKEIKEACFAAGMRGFITKPFKLERIEEIIKKLSPSR